MGYASVPIFWTPVGKRCQMKAPYSTKARAVQAAALVQKKHGGERLSSYKCPDCREHHLTSQKRQPK